MSKFLTIMMFLMIALTGCGGGGDSSSGTSNDGGSGSAENQSGGGDQSNNQGSDDGTGGDSGEEGGSNDNVSYSYDGAYKSASVTGDGYDSMGDFAGPSVAQSCDNMSDRYYDNGLVRVYSDGGVSDADLKAVGDQMRGVSEGVLSTFGFTGDQQITYEYTIHDSLDPMTLAKIEEYARNGIPGVATDHETYETGPTTVSLHAASSINLYMTQAEKEAYDPSTGSDESSVYVDAVMRVMSTVNRFSRNDILKELQDSVEIHEGYDPNEDTGGGLDNDDATGEPDFEIEPEDPQEYPSQKDNPEYAALYLDQIDPAIKVCVLSEGNVPNDFEITNSVNSIVTTVNASNRELREASVKNLMIQMTDMYRFDDYQSTPSWVKEGIATVYGNLEWEVADPEAIKKSDFFGNDVDPDLQGSVVTGLNNVESNDALINVMLMMSQEPISKPDHDAFKSVFNSTVGVPGQSGITYSNFVSGFDSIIDTIL